MWVILAVTFIPVLVIAWLLRSGIKSLIPLYEIEDERERNIELLRRRISLSAAYLARGDLSSGERCAQSYRLKKLNQKLKRLEDGQTT